MKIQTEGFTIEKIKGLASIISPALTGCVSNLAVTSCHEDEASNFVEFIIEDVTINYQYVFDSIEQCVSICRSLTITQLFVQDGTVIDLTTCGSVLVAGKTRSGKTYGIVSLLIQMLIRGPDRHYSMVSIIDPKQAELSRLPHTATVDTDGGGHAILTAIEKFAASMDKRQDIINNLIEPNGNPTHWRYAAMVPSILFIDEYISCRMLFPKKASKEEPTYSLEYFDALIKKIVTMGASAGCFIIISTAEASVVEGGLPGMLNI